MASCQIMGPKETQLENGTSGSVGISKASNHEYDERNCYNLNNIAVITVYYNINIFANISEITQSSQILCSISELYL